MALAQLKEHESCEICAKTARKEAVNDMKRNLIMDAAQRVIARDGYLSARLENIAEEAGFSKASIYHYFADKEALLANMAIRELRSDYEKCLDAVKRDLPFMEMIKAFVATFFDNEVLESGNPFMFDMASVMSSMAKHDHLMTELAELKMGTYELLRQQVEKARTNGVLDIPTNDEAVAAMILSFVNSTVMMRQFVTCINNMSKDEKNGVELRSDYEVASYQWIVESLETFLSPWLKKA